jgi:hypothetical protein
MKKLLLPLLFVSTLLTACPNANDQRYIFATEAVTYLLENTQDESVFLRFVYHGTPPFDDLGLMVLIRYSFDEDGSFGYRNFAYFSDTDVHINGLANELYAYRNSYTQLSATRFNEAFELTV